MEERTEQVMYFVTANKIFDVRYKETDKNYLVYADSEEAYIPIPKEVVCSRMYSAARAKEIYFVGFDTTGVFVSDSKPLKLYQVQRELCDRKVKVLRAQLSSMNAQYEGARAYRSMLDKRISEMQNKKED